MKKKNVTAFLIGIILIAVIVSLKLFNDGRERNVADLINYKPADFYSFGFTQNLSEVPEDKGFEWFTENQEPVNELMAFLSQYRVKKIAEKEFNNGELDRLFEFTISHSKANPAIVMVYENRVHILTGKFYQVLNGPIDINWVKQYNDKYKELYVK